MLILDPVYSQALVALGLDPQTYPVEDTAHSAGWGGQSTFTSTLAQVPVGLWSHWQAITNVGIKIGSDTKSMTQSDVNASSTKQTSSSISSLRSTLLVKGGPASASMRANTGKMSLRTTGFGSKIDSDKGTALKASTAEHKTSIFSNTSTNVNAVKKSNELNTKVSSHILQSNVKEYSVAVIGD